ncbi:MAG: hypothetical protein WDO19_10610 [Bacteroidota bacterium]
MQITNSGAITIIVIVSLLVLVLLIVKNSRDRKKILPPDAMDDTVSELKMDKKRKRDKI